MADIENELVENTQVENIQENDEQTETIQEENVQETVQAESVRETAVPAVTTQTDNTPKEKLHNEENPKEKKSKEKEHKIKICKEMERYGYLCDKIENKDFRRRIKYSFEYYVKCANFYKYMGMTLSILGIVLPAIATFLTVCGAWPPLIAAFTTLSTIASGLFAYLKCTDKQETYRTAVENMKAELIAYITRQGDYKEGNMTEGSDKDTLLFVRLESIIQKGYDKITALERRNEGTEE
ncbi:MAG: DUF4231 domain-containing protein [Clostridiales bacterium]|nr:DUF4231 domain-containing protein [Clostridiales bacterium]